MCMYKTSYISHKTINKWVILSQPTYPNALIMPSPFLALSNTSHPLSQCLPLSYPTMTSKDLIYMTLVHTH